MANIVAKKGNTTVEIIKSINNDGVAIEYIAINGTKIGVMGYTSPEDREAGISAIQKVIEKSQTENTHEIISNIMSTMTTMAEMTEKEIDPNEIEGVEIDDMDYIIDYKAKKIYTKNCKVEIANLDDITEKMSKNIIKTMLIDRAKLAIAERCDDYDECDCDDYDDEY